MTLNLDSFGDSPKKKSKYKAALGVGSVLGLFGIGSTLAANISLNGGGNVEFGQGVATTAACDEDGFEVTPHTIYDNAHSIFRVDYVEVSGLDLTPQGTGWDDPDANVSDQNGVDGVTRDDAELQYKGQYFDGTNWKRTCDNVVLDFKAYTNDPEYAKYTDDAYDNPNDGSITSPVGWTQGFNEDSSELNWIRNAGFATVFDSYNDDGSGYTWNYAVYGNSQNDWHGNEYDMELWNDNLQTMYTSNATFKFANRFDDNRPNAASISKITVQSMATFPSSYYANNQNGLGSPSTGWY